MKQYPEYKDSGIEWIGNVPTHWDTRKLKWIIKEKLKYGANEVAELDDNNLPRFIRITDFGDDGNLKYDTFKSLPYDKAKDFLLHDGDILFARSGATVGKTFQFKKYNGKACFAGYLIKASLDNKKAISDFIYLYTKSTAYENWKNSIFSQATIQNIGADKYQYLDTVIPSIREQQTIANYLDHKTKKIDTLIEKKQKLIELLKEQRTAIINQAVTKGLNPDVKMKDSGIEWLGKVPEHWNVKRLKYDISIKSGEGIASEDIKSEGQYVAYGGNGLLGYCNSYNTNCETLVIGRVGAKCGNIHIITGHYWITDNALVVKTNQNYRFFYYLLKAMNLNFLANHNAQPLITGTMVKDQLIATPISKEQQTIANDLDHKTKKIDTLIEKQICTIKYLKEYRTALISNVVTGKIDVRDEVINDTH